MNYYNEFEPYAAQWLRNLIAEGLIPAGDVDTRSITDVQPDDLAGYRQCHFFAGIGGWSLAARLAGWPDNRELWTGSAPCQPFSVAGKGKAQADDRHLWPHLFRLARARRPAVLMGEQVAAAVGKDWIDGVFADLEGIGYTCGASVVPACAVDAPHRRDRLWFVAHALRQGSHACALGGVHRGEEGAGTRDVCAPRLCGAGNVADANCAGFEPRRRHDPSERHGNATAAARSTGGDRASTGPVPNSQSIGEREPHDQDPTISVGWPTRLVLVERSHWDGAGWVIGHDGKARRVEPSIRLLAHGVPSRVGRLRAYGNAIAPPLAAEVIGAYLDCYPDPAEQLRAALATN